MRELPELEVGDYQTAEAAVGEEEIDAIPLVTDTKPSLTAEEGKTTTEFQHESFEIANQRVFQLALGILILQSKEFQSEGVLDFFFGQ